MKNVFYCFFTIALVLFSTACTTINSVEPPVNQDISVLNKPIGTTFDCKCKYYKKDKIHNKSQLDTFSIVAHKYALMSFNAYDDKPQIIISGWKRVERFETWKGFGADVYLSTPNENELAVSFRGTDGASINDWFWGNFNFYWKGQYADAADTFEIIRKKYGKKPTIVTGHSLGGGLAMHIAIHNDEVTAYVFDSSPRVFANGQYDKHDNNIFVISESGEILESARKVFTTMKKIKPHYYRYNYLGGNAVKEHKIQNFSQCMYKTSKLTDIDYSQECKNKI